MAEIGLPGSELYRALYCAVPTTCISNSSDLAASLKVAAPTKMLVCIGRDTHINPCKPHKYCTQ